jgi:hypothetical protein
MCPHLWLPKRGAVYRYVFCGRCHETRRVCRRWGRPAPLTIAAALREAIDENVVPADEVRWNGLVYR